MKQAQAEGANRWIRAEAGLGAEGEAQAEEGVAEEAEAEAEGEGEAGGDEGVGTRVQGLGVKEIRATSQHLPCLA
ncbi:hypothetical protein CLOM_g19056 [Closterium sp. NIES-68]|nr:hypothetical protein CLOM_g19056 [Closterium sp. NIES-68]